MQADVSLEREIVNRSIEQLEADLHAIPEALIPEHGVAHEQVRSVHVWVLSFDSDGVIVASDEDILDHDILRALYANALRQGLLVSCSQAESVVGRGGPTARGAMKCV